MIKAKESELAIWGNGGRFARYDYVTDNYLMSEMMNNDFFGECWALLHQGDFIMITDCEDQILMIRIDSVDKVSRKTEFSKLERLYAMPVVEQRDIENDPGLVYRWRPTRAGGHSIVTAEGAVFAINFSSKAEAERVIANVYESGTFEPPVNHEPRAPFVTSAKVFRA